MPSEAELEASTSEEVEASLNEVAAHLQKWLNDRFVADETAIELTIFDIAGLIAWLNQWKDHFASYAEQADALEASGKPALKARLAQIFTEIDKSIANVGQMADGLS
jgi:hypothetical protein